VDITAAFTTLVNSTPNSFASHRDEFINDVQRDTYISSELIAGRSKKKLLRSGPKIKDRIYLEQGQQLHTYTPGRKGNVSNPQTGTNHESHWAALKVDMTWTEAEEEFNVNAASYSKSGMMDHLKSVMKQKEQDAYTAATEGLDDLMFAVPNAGTMEHTDTTSQDATVRSIPSFINEETNGLYAGYNLTGTFTTIQGINPATNPNWKCQQFSYDNADANFDNPDINDNLLAVLSKAKRRTDLQRPKTPFPGAYEERTPVSMMMVVTNSYGHDRMENAFRNSPENFMTVSPTDPTFGQMTIGGRPLIEYTRLDDLTLYPHASDATALVSSNDENGARIGPRFYFINCKYLTPFFRQDKFFQKRQARELDGTVGGYWCPIVLWMQIFAHSLRRHAIVYPKAQPSGGS
jgi:hypothetical protein